MKFLILLVTLILISCSSRSQNMIGIYDDTLTHYKNLYKAHFNRENVFSASKGNYFVIFEQCLDYQKLEFYIYNSLRQPVLARRYNGYYMFSLDTNSTFLYKINYQGKFCDSVSVLAKIFSPTPPLINKITGINLNDLKSNLGNRAVINKPMIFLFWNTRNKISLDYFNYFYRLSTKYNHIIFVYFSDENKDNLNEFVEKAIDKENIVFVNDRFYKLGPNIGTFSIPMVLLINKENIVVYKNRIENRPVPHIHNRIYTQLDSLLSLQE
ncbi:MAG: TlpA family protein disulfide reductase [Cyclobacteriaceae bacterium]